MIQVTNLPEKDLREIGLAYANYLYPADDKGMFPFDDKEMLTNYIVGFARSCMQSGMLYTTSENHEGLHRNHRAGYQISVSGYQNIHPGSYQLPWLETLSLVCKGYRQRRR